MLADLTSGPFIGLWVVLWYLIFAIFIVSCLRKGHIVWFILGFFLPICWFIALCCPGDDDHSQTLRVEERVRALDPTPPAGRDQWGTPRGSSDRLVAAGHPGWP